MDPPYCSNSKAGGPYFKLATGLQKDLNLERWGVGTPFDCMSAVDAFLQTHSLGDQMSLCFSFFTRGELIRHSADGSELIQSHVDNYCTGEHRIGLFDVIESPQDNVIYFKIGGIAEVCGEFSEDLLLNDGPREVMFRAFPIYLETGQEYTYMDLLRLAYRSERDLLLDLACSWLSSHEIYIEESSGFDVTSIHENGALLWPAIREIIKADEVTFLYNYRGQEKEETISTNSNTTIYQQASMKDVDFWMF